MEDERLLPGTPFTGGHTMKHKENIVWQNEILVGPTSKANAETVEDAQLELEGERAFLRTRFNFEKSKKPHIFTAEERKRMDNYESIDYEEPHSLLYKEHLKEKRREQRWAKWVLFVAVGLVTGLWSVLLFQTQDLLAETKKDTFESIVNDRDRAVREAGGDYRKTINGVSVSAMLSGYAMHVLWSGTAALLSSLCCLVMPTAAGSGVPDVMAYLNGVMFQRIFNVRNLVVKTLSCICAVSSGLPVGAEGPMIHIGALIGAGLPTGRSRSLKCSASGLLKMFRNTKDHRDFITAGAACGVTSAFSSPIGGLLFVMEEVATFMPMKLSWMVFVSCLACMLAIQVMNSYLTGWKLRDREGLSWGNFQDNAITIFKTDFASQRLPLNLFTFFPTVVIGVAMGIVAVAFTVGNIFLIRKRNKLIFPKPILRVLEPCLFALVYSTLSFALPLMFHCRPIPPIIASLKTEGLDLELVTAYCSSDNEYHPLASLTMTNNYNVIRILFSRFTRDLLPWHAVLIYLLQFSLGAMTCSGMFISSGIVIPTVLIGSLGGRLIGGWFGVERWADPGTAALIGAAAFFGGLARLTFSLIVIMMEITNDLSHISCLMVGIIIAKTIADKFCHSLYHAMLEVKCVPFLEVQTQVHKFDTFAAKDIMTKPVTVLKTEEVVLNLVEVLKVVPHNCFPIISPSDSIYKGTVQRSQLQLLLWFIYFRHTGRIAHSSHSPQATYSDLQAVREIIFWERLPTCPSELPPVLVHSTLDLTPYVDSSALFVRDSMCISRTYYIFRILGLRHLPVLNRNSHVVGIITRTNLVGDRMDEHLEAVQKSAEEDAHVRRRKRRL
jgi:chloride channel 7